MGIYRKVCYSIENVFVKILSGKQEPEQVKTKVQAFRQQKEAAKQQKKQSRLKEINQKNQLRLEEEQKKQKEIERKKDLERKEVLTILSTFVNMDGENYTDYEFNEIKQNKLFFQELKEKSFDKDEQGLTFIKCEFDKSSKKEIPGYLIVTNKRVLFIDRKAEIVQKFRYQTIKNVTWFQDGLFEKGFYMQYGVKKLEFDEIFDKKQMDRVGAIITQLAKGA